jgi:carboxyl-terminal processing protease
LQREVIGALQDHFYRDVDLDELEDGAVRGLIEGVGDDYTSYFDPEEFASFKEHQTGSYSGVGMSVELEGEAVTVITVFKGSPAEEARIRPGDVILGVGGESVKGLSLEEVVARIKGPEDTKVELLVYDPPADAPPLQSVPEDLEHVNVGREVELVRQEIDVPVVEAENLVVDGQQVAHIRFFTFSEDSAEKLQEAVNQAVDEGATAVLLDLRGNGGGLLEEAVDVASIFIEDGVIVTTEGLHSPKEVYQARGDAIEDVPVYVLVDEFSASASEIVAGALQDSERAVVVGETTFGKGLVQQIVPLSNGGAVKVTTAVYLTPDGHDINEKGVEPQVEAADDQETEADEALDRALELIAEG